MICKRSFSSKVWGLQKKHSRFLFKPEWYRFQIPRSIKKNNRDELNLWRTIENPNQIAANGNNEKKDISFNSMLKERQYHN